METARCEAGYASHVEAEVLAEIELQSDVARDREGQPSSVVEVVFKVGRLGAANQEITTETYLQSDEIHALPLTLNRERS